MNRTCYPCGNNQADTKDHISPNNLFPKSLPPYLPTAPCCTKCNNSLADDEEIFRILVAQGRAYGTESGLRIWDERVRPSLKQNKRGFKTLLRKLVKTVKLSSGASAEALEIDQKRVNSVLKKIAKGLYYLDKGEPLPDYIELLFKYSGYDWSKLKEPPFDTVTDLLHPGHSAVPGTVR